MAEISTGVRAKNGYIEVEKTDKAGRKYKGREHMVASSGMYSGKEMEKVMREVAADVGASEDQIRIETYQSGEAPIEVNPRHRGIEDQIYFRGSHRKFWGGFNPKTDR